ncbi:lasso peptide biosynthesis B2 protein [Acaryochloris sp. IP29b_bin.137]|uniref:lasso peptide biosynthesis B2 protein n=1 Tax=Acaryochloris sp. IP29b_bin.137 TaxID=2969217 RepID=UPI002611FE50|nr:lasso peptide biosynthesis B2 protein [Acaryochloris sp. IP29b_bin.137]
MSPVLKLLRLQRCDRTLLIKTYLLLGFIRLGLWLLPFQTLQKWLATLHHPPHADPAAPSPRISRRTLRAVVWAVNTSSRYMPGDVKCLARALVTQVLIYRRGYRPELKIGVAKTADCLEAHAWVELQGHVIMGLMNDLSRFTPMPSLESKM